MSDESAGVFQGSVPENYRLHLEPVIFRPWAERLIKLVGGLRPGQIVLDVAAGTGVVSRAAASLVGPTGRVVASDISAAMLAHVATGADAAGARIETAECSATDLTMDDDIFDAVLCQQGFPFIPDRVAAAAEMKRVLQPGGVAGAAVWHKGAVLQPFETYARVLGEGGVAEPFPGAFTMSTFEMTEDEVRDAMVGGGLADVVTVVETIEPSWASPKWAAIGITGTPFGPSLLGLEEGHKQELMDALVAAFTSADGGLIPMPMTAVIGRGTA